MLEKLWVATLPIFWDLFVSLVPFNGIMNLPFLFHTVLNSVNAFAFVYSKCLPYNPSKAFHITVFDFSRLHFSNVPHEISAIIIVNNLLSSFIFKYFHWVKKQCSYLYDINSEAIISCCCFIHSFLAIYV